MNDLEEVEDQANYTVKAAAKRVGRSVRTLERWIDEGLPCRTVAGMIVIEHKDLLAFFRTRLLNDPTRTRRDW